MSIPQAPTHGPAPARSGRIPDLIGDIATAYYWELRKLVAQKRTWLGIAAAALVPVIFLVSIQISKVTPHDGPYDTPLGPNLRHSGLALDLVVLTLIAYIGPAILTALVAGDIVAGEDMAGTLKTILVRSVRRGHILAGKMLALFTYVLAALVAFAVFGIGAGVITWGFHPLVNLSGQQIPAAHALGLALAALAVYALPVIAIAGFGLFLSVVSRNSVAAVVGTVFYALALQGLAAFGAIVPVRPYILVTQLKTWQGFFQTPTDWAIIGHGLWVSALYLPPPLIAAYILFRQRDVAS
jgi:ABC-2 type transport system permease protein